MSSSLIKISVIVPVYNVEKYLKQCINSILAQTLKEIEILAIDDGSTDNSWEIIKDLASRDGRIVPIQQRNQGVSIARNTGLKRARGEYVGFVDSDDFIDPAYFENLYEAAVSDKADIVSGYVVMENERRQHFYNYTNKRTAERSKCSLVGVVWLNIYRSSMLHRNNIFFPPNLRTAEDNLFNLQASYYANKVVSAKNQSVVYHQIARRDSLTAQQYDSKSLLPLSYAILETIHILNSYKDYEPDVYTLRILDTLNYFYQRFIEANHLDVFTRYRISMVFMRIWREVKYRPQILDAIKEKGIDLEKVVHGKLANRLYARYVIKLNGERKEDILKKINKKNIKALPKRAVKFLMPHGVFNIYQQRHIKPVGNILDDKKIAVIAAYDITYTDLLHDAIKTAGYTSSKKVSDAKYIWLHWYENGIVDYEKFVQRVTSLKVWKQQGRKIIFHIHNKKPHEAAIPSVSHALMTVLADSADRVSIMSEPTKDVLQSIWYYGDNFAKVSKVRHPNYIGSYGKLLKAPASLTDSTLKILFFGLVRPYKGIEKLLEATKDLKNVEISIFGKPKDDQYIADLKALCADRSNVTFRFEHIPDNDIPKIFASHHVVALPYSIESSLNSGAAILALSYARTVIGTNNGTLRELSDSSVYFGYDYKDEEDHVVQLKKTIQTVQKKYDGKYNELLEVGERAYQLVKKDNSTQAIAESIQEMIKRIG